ncbi:Cytidine deaminase, homotetrameric [Paramyrothecium foliicola]|nr:Cytidine deaminase, homotetrameric [Paramyrothecium foliicola]
MAATAELLSSSDAASVAETCRAFDLTAEQFSRLRSEASAAKATAYCVYSQFRVGAALLGADGQAVITGANVENASYPVGTCAERVALGRAVTSEGPMRHVQAIVSDDLGSALCGFAIIWTWEWDKLGWERPRAMTGIREFCTLEMPIIMFDKNEDYIVRTLGELLPLSFGPDQLPTPPPLKK